MAEYPCLWCDAEFNDHVMRSNHVLWDHSGTEILEQRGRYVVSRRLKFFHPNNKRKPHFVCWCGEAIYGDNDAFSRHLVSRGGLEAHILEIILGE